MRFLGLVLFGLSVLLVWAPASAQYMYLDANGDGAHSSADTLNVPGLTTVDVWLRTDRNRDGTPATCTGGSFDLFSYDVIMQATGGTIAWGTYSNLLASMSLQDQTSDSTVLHVSCSGSSTVAAGTYKLGTLTLLVRSGRPTLDLVAQTDRGPYATGFGTHCSGTINPNTSTLGQDWTDVDGLMASSQDVYFTEDFETGSLPNYWSTHDDNVSSGSTLWGVTGSGCGYVEGSYSGTPALGFCNSYANDQLSVLERNAMDMSAFTQYHVAFEERHELASNDTLTYQHSLYDPNDPFRWYDAPPLGITGSVTVWTKRAASTVDNVNHSADSLKLKFVFRSDASSNSKGFYLDNVQVIGTRRADLIVTSVTAVGSLIGGQGWTLRYTIQNNGQIDAGAFKVQPYVDNTPSGSYIQESGLTAGASRTTSWLMPSQSTGDHTIKLTIDTGGDIDEGNTGEANNQYPCAYCQELRYTWAAPPGPDLIVQSLSASPAIVTMGQKVNVTAVVKNVGTVSVTTPFAVTVPQPPVTAEPDSGVRLAPDSSLTGCGISRLSAF